MIVQPDWRAIFSVALLSALSTLPAANAQQQDATSMVRNSEMSAKGIERPRPEYPIKYWGNSFSLKFHRPSCPFAKAMSAHHVMFFNFRRQAVEAGQVPCRYCLPPNWTTVRAALWHPAELLKKDLSTPEPTFEPVDAPSIPPIPPQLPKLPANAP